MRGPLIENINGRDHDAIRGSCWPEVSMIISGNNFTGLTDTSMILLSRKSPRPCCNSDARWSHYMITHFFSLPPRPLTLPPPPLPPPEPIDPGPVIPR